VPLPDLKASVEKMMKQKKELQARLAKLKGGSVKPVSKVEKEKTEREWRRLRTVAKNRQKIRVEMWKAVQGIAPKETWEELKEEFDLKL
jgi:26S proteasome regulatory subunit (ATPase 3-interacting protein)